MVCACIAMHVLPSSLMFVTPLIHTHPFNPLLPCAQLLPSTWQGAPCATHVLGAVKRALGLLGSRSKSTGVTSIDQVKGDAADLLEQQLPASSTVVPRCGPTSDEWWRSLLHMPYDTTVPASAGGAAGAAGAQVLTQSNIDLHSTSSSPVSNDLAVAIADHGSTDGTRRGVPKDLLQQGHPLVRHISATNNFRVFDSGSNNSNNNNNRDSHARSGSSGNKAWRQKLSAWSNRLKRKGRDSGGGSSGDGTMGHGLPVSNNDHLAAFTGEGQRATRPGGQQHSQGTFN